jgi:hypothetical protein
VSKFAAPLIKDPEVKRLADAVTTFANSVAATYVTKDQLQLPTTAQQIVRNAGQEQTQTAAAVDLQNQRTTEGIIKRILENSGTEAPIQLSSPVLFRAGGSATNVWIGAGGIGGMYTGIPTWGIDSQTGGFFFGKQTTPSNQITFNSATGELTFGANIRINTSSPVTLQQLYDSASAAGYTDADVSRVMNAGVSNIVAVSQVTGSTYKLDVNGGSVMFYRTGAAVGAYSSLADTTNTALPAVVMNAAGLAMGYNGADGAWKNAVVIESNGNFAFGATVGKQISFDATTGEFILGSNVRLASAAGKTVTQLLADVAAVDYSTAMLQTDLNLGVGKLVAGIGSNFRLDVDTANGLVWIRHKDANYNVSVGAYTGVVRTGLGITANGIAAGYNRQSDGAWVNSFSIDSTTGVATFSGTVNAAAGNFVGNVTIGQGGAIRSGQTAYNTGTGFWLEYNGGTPRFSIGSSTGQGLTWDGSALSINGALTSGSTFGGLTLPVLTNANITIDGSGNLVGIGTAGVKVANSAITMQPNGTLVGGGGGAVTIAGLGFTGALNATNNLFYQQGGAPAGGKVGDVWYDTTAATLKMMVSSGTWASVGDITSGKTAANISGQGAFATTSQINGSNYSSLIAAGTIHADRLVASSITASQIAAGQINASHIQAGAITAGMIGAGTLAAGVVYAGTVSATQISAGTLGAGVIYAGTISAGNIQAGTISGSVTSSLNVKIAGVTYQADSPLIGNNTNAGPTGYHCGIIGQSLTNDKSIGVVGYASGGAGVVGISTLPTGSGVYGISPGASGYGVYSDGNAIVVGSLTVTNGVSGVQWTSISGRPTSVSQFSNDMGYVTSSGLQWTSISGRPTSLSQFSNDMGYVTSSGTVAVSNYAFYLYGAGSVQGPVYGLSANRLLAYYGNTSDPSSNFAIPPTGWGQFYTPEGHALRIPYW